MRAFDQLAVLVLFLLQNELRFGARGRLAPAPIAVGVAAKWTVSAGTGSAPTFREIPSSSCTACPVAAPRLLVADWIANFAKTDRQSATAASAPKLMPYVGDLGPSWR